MTFFVTRTFKRFYMVKVRQAIVFLDTFFAPFLSAQLRAARYATVCFEQNRYSDFVLTAAFLCLLVTVFELTGRLKENFLFILLSPLFPIPNKKKKFFC